MSLPRVIAKIVYTGTLIFGRALAEAGRQAVRSARHVPDAAEGPQDTASGSTTGRSPTAQISLTHRLTLQEARLILNVKPESEWTKGEWTKGERNYEHIFKANSPPPPPAPTDKPTPQTAKSRAASKGPTHSHYLQSKVYRALERLKAEKELAEGPKVAETGAEGEAGVGVGAAGEAGEGTTTTPPPAGTEGKREGTKQ